MAETINPLEERMRKELVTYMVQRKIFCPVTNEVLDVRTCVVFLDDDGDPADVVSQAGYQHLKEYAPDKLETLKGMGYTVDESTVKEG
jgi:hypothetical protein